MKKQFILPLSLLLSFVAVRASDVPAVDPSVQVAGPVAPAAAETPTTQVVEIPATQVAEPVAPSHLRKRWKSASLCRATW